MMLGARTGAWSGGAKWKNPYITDGLVAMWDGLWSDPSLAIIDGGDWVDCIGGARLTGVTKTDVGVSVIKGSLSDKIFDNILTVEHLGAVSDQSMLYTIYSNSLGYGYFGIGKKYRGWPSDPLKQWYTNYQITIRDNGDGSQTAINTPTNSRKTTSDVYNPSVVAYKVSLGAGTAGVTYSPYKSIRLYSRLLTDDEIAHNYEIDKVRFNLP